MSSRVLKKLHGESDLGIIEQDEQLSDVEGGDTGTGSDISGSKKKQINNRYDLLNEQSLSESEVKEDDNETEHPSTTAPHPEQAKKKKKKRKKKSGKQSASTNRRSSEDNADLDDITRTVKEVAKLFGESTQISSINAASSPSTSSNSVIKALLSIQHKNLNSTNEMKRMFGSKVVQAEQSKRRRGPRTLKSTWLVSPKENWPPISKTGIYMTVEQSHSSDATVSPTHSKAIINDNRGKIWFKYQHHESYRQLQEKFLKSALKNDSDVVIQIINQQPYHVDSLIQLSELCKISDDLATASELIERAVLALETSFHSMFSLTAGNCRLDYRRQENRSFFLALFKHAQFLNLKACSRTALEITKLLLSLDPETDPLALILIIDYYALRAKEYKWLIELYNAWETSNNLAQLPNMSYSLALALFYRDDDLTLADSSLQYALLMFPGVLKPLLNEMSVQIDARVNSHSFFGPQAFSSQPPALQQLTLLYVHRSKIVWRDSDILPWLERNVNIALDKVDAKDNIIVEYSNKRSQRYNQTPPMEILRHIVLSDLKEKVPLAPFIDTDSESIWMYDPLPPLNSIDIYPRPNILTSTSHTLDPFSMFFQSLSPNFNIRNDGHVGATVEQIEAAAAAIQQIPGDGPGEIERNYLRNSLTSIVDAMREFLTNIRVPERPNDADVDENESTDDDDANNYLT